MVTMGVGIRKHHLLPPERWFAEFILRRQQTHRTPAIIRMEHNYGREGIILFAAAIMTELLGGVVCAGGVLLLFVIGDSGSLPYITIGVGALVIAFGMIRTVQGARIGRRFRGDRPFLKRPGR